MAVHALHPGEVEAILELVEEWGPIDRSTHTNLRGFLRHTSTSPTKFEEPLP